MPARASPPRRRPRDAAAPATVPDAPQNLAAAPGDGEVTLTWQAPANDGGSAVTGYDYRHAEGASVPAETAWQSAGTSLTATIAGLTNGTGYAFEVRAVNDAGEGEPSTAAATPAVPATVPDAPQNLAAAPGDGEVTLTWQAPASDGGSAVTGYDYRHAEGAYEAWQSAATRPMPSRCGCRRRRCGNCDACRRHRTWRQRRRSR